MPSDTEPLNAFMVFMNVTNTLTHLILGSIATSALLFATVFPIKGHFTQHIYLCVTGYILMMSQAILIFSPHNGLSISLRQQDKKVVHLVMQVVGAILAITGSCIRMSNLTNNFQSAHGILGLIAMYLTFISLIGCVINLLYKKKSHLINFVHSCVGSLTLVTVFICLCFGFDKTIFRTLFGQTYANMSIVLSALGLVGTLLAASISNGKRLFKR